MATGNSIWDDYQQSQQVGWTPPPGIEGRKAPPTTTSGNDQWKKNQLGNTSQPASNPVNSAQSAQPSKPYTLPAVDQLTSPVNTPAALASPNQKTPAQDVLTALNQIPIGGIGASFGYRSQPMNLDSFTNQGGEQQQPTLTGYHWYAGTGGVSGGNNAYARYGWSDNSVTREPAGSQYDMPKLGLPRSEQPSIGTVRPYTISPENIQSYTAAGGKGDWDYSLPAAPVFRGQNLPYTMVNGQPTQWGSVPAGGDPSVGALQNAQKSTNELGQQVMNPVGGGQIITGLPLKGKDKPWLGGY